MPVLSFLQSAQKWAPPPLEPWTPGQILAVLRGCSVSVGGCPLAERHATIHPPGSCNPKREGTKSRGTMQPAASGVEMGVRVPSLAFMHGEEVLFGCSQAPCSKKVCLCFTWQRHGRSSLVARLSEQPPSSGLQSYSQHSGAPGCFPPQTSGWHPGSESRD